MPARGVWGHDPRKIFDFTPEIVSGVVLGQSRKRWTT